MPVGMRDKNHAREGYKLTISPLSKGLDGRFSMLSIRSPLHRMTLNVSRNSINNPNQSPQILTTAGTSRYTEAVNFPDTQGFRGFLTAYQFDALMHK
jgi:hypothetical protein